MKVLSDPSPRWEPFAIAALLLVTASVATAQNPPPRDLRVPSTQGPVRDRAPARTIGTAVVKGRVVDGVTGSPVARARVRLVGGPNARGAMLTDSEGAFQFTRVVAGGVSLIVEKATYLPGRYPDSTRTLRGRAVPTMIADGQAMDLTVKMFRGAAIAGRVVDSYGDPLDNVDVRAMSIPRGRPPMYRGSGSTNDLGEFRLARLEPGTYVLSVTPRNMSAYEDPNAPPTVLPQPTPVFYPGAASPEQAQAIVVNRAETISGIEVVLGEGIPTVVDGVVSGPDGVMAKVNGSISARLAVSGPQQGPPMVSAPVRPDGTFRMQLTAGQYILEARVYPQAAPGEAYQPSRELFAMQPITIGGSPTESITMLVGKGATASGRIVFESATIPAAPVGKPVRPPIYFEESNGCRTSEATIAADWTFKIDGLMGTCSAPLPNILGKWTLNSLRIGGVDAIEKPVTFEPGRHYGNVEIVVTDKPSQITPQVTGDDGQATREYVVLAFPFDKAAWKRGARAIRTLVPRILTFNPNSPPPPQALANLQSNDVINGLFPGDYYVISLDDIDVEDVFDPVVLEKLAGHATRVSVAQGGVTEVSLRRLKIQDILR